MKYPRIADTDPSLGPLLAIWTIIGKIANNGWSQKMEGPFEKGSVSAVPGKIYSATIKFDIFLFFLPFTPCIWNVNNFLYMDLSEISFHM